MLRTSILAACAVACLAALLASPAGAAGTRSDRHGTIVVDGRKTFPIALLKPPPLDGVTPWGTGAVDEVVAGGVNMLAVGPWGREWVDEDLLDAHAWNQAAAARGVHTWVHLRELARATEASPQEARLLQVVPALRDHPAVAMWLGVDEPWWSGYPASLLERSFRILKELDPTRLTITNQAPRGRPEDLAPYTAVTDVHSVDVYPVKFKFPDPNLHTVGFWTRRIASVTPNRAVFTILQICTSAADDPAGSGALVMPTFAQARYMAYDAIMNGARGLGFYGGQWPLCQSPEDAALGWHWTYWSGVLRPLLAEIGPRSPLYPFLLTPGTELRVRSSDRGTPVVARRVGREVWVIAARYTRGTKRVTVSGLPRALTRRGWVYREGRRIAIRSGAFSDRFSRWDVHVYRFPR